MTTAEASGMTETAVLAGGCFRGVEAWGPQVSPLESFFPAED